MSLSHIIDSINAKKIDALKNQYVQNIITQYVTLCKPSKVSIITDSEEDSAYIKQLALQNGEEKELAVSGHQVHFDGPLDQGRDKENTKILIPADQNLGKKIHTGERESHISEIINKLDGIMRNKEMIIRFFCLGPTQSKFAICAMQITDSAYLAHSEELLYRKGYEEFKRLSGASSFFHFIHSTGELENGIVKNIDQRRIYIDLKENRAFSINCQYAGNVLGLKKLALRLAIQKAQNESWLCEHMFLMGINQKNRTSYFTGAFPSACGKTSTAMLPGQNIVGDDMSYIHSNDGKAYGVNVEQGIFGIIEDVNPIDDPLIYEALTTPREIIFSNVLVTEGYPYWTGMGKNIPKSGDNYLGKWTEDKLDVITQKPIPPSHKNARYTIRLQELKNCDPKLHDPHGYPISGFIYGGRDSDTSPPVLQSLSWNHGVFIGATVESETTAATLGKQGMRTHDPMANLDFLSVPLGMYIRNHFSFGNKLSHPPLIFATNYFIKYEGKYLHDKIDKKVWILWMEARAHQEYCALKTPIGFIPLYEDIKTLFKNVFQKDYTKDDYELAFSIRAQKLIERLDRMQVSFQDEANIPQEFYHELEAQRSRLLHAIGSFQSDTISPFEFPMV